MFYGGFIYSVMKCARYGPLCFLHLLLLALSFNCYYACITLNYYPNNLYVLCFLSVCFLRFFKNVIQNALKISSKNEDVLCLYIINNVVVSV